MPWRRWTGRRTRRATSGRTRTSGFSRRCGSGGSPGGNSWVRGRVKGRVSEEVLESFGKIEKIGGVSAVSAGNFAKFGFVSGRCKSQIFIFQGSSGTMCLLCACCVSYASCALRAHSVLHSCSFAALAFSPNATRTNRRPCASPTIFSFTGV